MSKKKTPKGGVILDLDETTDENSPVDSTPSDVVIETQEPEQDLSEEFAGQGGRYISIGGGKRKLVPAKDLNA